jgi:hypothetical protein
MQDSFAKGATSGGAELKAEREQGRQARQREGNMAAIRNFLLPDQQNTNSRTADTSARRERSR